MNDYIGWLTLLIIIFLTVWFLMQFVGRARRYCEQKTDLSSAKIKNLALFGAALCFVLINPFNNIIIAGAALALYYFIVDRSGLTSLNDLLSRSTRTRHLVSSKDNSTASVKIDLDVTSTLDLDAVSTRKRLDKCLFSFPFIDDTSHINLYRKASGYHLSVAILSQQYIESLISYLEKSGFDSQLKNN